MASRSWLAHVSDVREIGGMFYAPKTHGPLSEKKEDARAEERWDAARNRPVPQNVVPPEFFGSCMHDSGVIGIEREKGALRVRLDSIVAEDFSCILSRALDGPPAEGPWPVDLLLHDPTYVRVARADARGALRFEDPHRLGGGYLDEPLRPSGRVRREKGRISASSEVVWRPFSGGEGVGSEGAGSLKGSGARVSLRAIRGFVVGS